MTPYTGSLSRLDYICVYKLFYDLCLWHTTLGVAKEPTASNHGKG